MVSEWLSIAGDAGSALGGLTIFGTGIGFLVRRKSKKQSERLALAGRLAPVVRDSNNLQVLFERWVREPHAVDSDKIKNLWIATAAPLIDMDLTTADPQMKRIIQHLNSVAQALAIRMGTIGSKFSTRHPLYRHYQDINALLYFCKLTLASKKDDPLDAYYKIIPMSTNWHDAMDEMITWANDQPPPSQRGSTA